MSKPSSPIHKLLSLGPSSRPIGARLGGSAVGARGGVAGAGDTVADVGWLLRLAVAMSSPWLEHQLRAGVGVTRPSSVVIPGARKHLCKVSS